MEYQIKVEEIQKLPEGEYKVSLAFGERHQENNVYTVQVDEVYLTALGWEPNAVTELIRASFVFLLERESPSSILKQFNLRVIAKYFPEYEETIKMR